MDSIFAVIAGLGIRFALQFTSGSQRSRIGPMLLGFWEGVCVHYSANASPNPGVPYLGYLLRIALDLILSDSPFSVLLTILWTLLGALFSEALAPVATGSADPGYPPAPSPQLPTPPATLLDEVGNRQIPLPQQSSSNPTSSAAPHDHGAIDHRAQDEDASDHPESPIEDSSPRIIIPPPPQPLSSPNILSAIPVEVPFSPRPD
ncbi:uncharacterized protein EV420DRAFT_1640821 [Desarmillaria tabescens]|uniref:Uncharacterized protein n=1 Tax=Armillaria tabescens TaxID=1929756 RepID=A0AA39TRD5_ARMTA|nr:uncharacterized protein EV420DRAFT_1640821 [Desarmillaria tabescens]KAK0461339.1 hypothetical protein EV420DRAFT_1640821 [Desarmillaria tabescens]